jgi:hypothetical protein
MHSMLASAAVDGPQALTFAIPLGVFALVVLWGVFQWHSTR